MDFGSDSEDDHILDRRNVNFYIFFPIYEDKASDAWLIECKQIQLSDVKMLTLQLGRLWNHWGWKMCSTSTINHNMVTTVSQLKIFIIIQIWTSSALYQNILFPIVVNIICHPPTSFCEFQKIYSIFDFVISQMIFMLKRLHLPQVNFYFLLRKWSSCIDWLKETLNS